MGYKELITLMMRPDKEYLLNMGSGKLSKAFKISRQEVIDAKKEVRESLNRGETTSHGTRPNILILDIETAPIKAFVWRLWKQDVALSQIVSDWYMLTWSAKWLGEDSIMSQRLTGREAEAEDDSRILDTLWKLLDKADMIVAHNGNMFDIPKINSRFFMNGFPPPSPYKQIDTKVIASRQFGFSSNKLDALAGYIGIDHKMHTSFSLWSKCVSGDDEALEYMETYNVKDVEILEEVYIKLRPWIPNHPNVAVYSESIVPTCSVCGSTHLTFNDKYHYTNLGKYAVYTCECGAHNSQRTNLLSSEKRKSLLLKR